MQGNIKYIYKPSSMKFHLVDCLHATSTLQAFGARTDLPSSVTTNLPTLRHPPRGYLARSGGLSFALYICLRRFSLVLGGLSFSLYICLRRFSLVLYNYSLSFNIDIGQGVSLSLYICLRRFSLVLYNYSLAFSIDIVVSSIFQIVTIENKLTAVEVGYFVLLFNSSISLRLKPRKKSLLLVKVDPK